MTKLSLLRLPLVLALLTAGVAQAELVVLTGQDTALSNPGVPAGSMAAGKRQDFNDNITSVKTESFDTRTLGDLTSLSVFNDGSGLVTAPARLGALRARVSDNEYNSDQTVFLGRFDTTSPYKIENGTETNTGRWLQSTVGFTLEFGGDFSAFGFYGTDFGDFQGEFSIELLTRNINTGALEKATGFTALELASLQIPRLAGSGNTDANTVDGENGSLLFYGLYDTTRAYAGVRFVVKQCTTDDGSGNPLPCGEGYDELGFDDFVVGNFKPPVDVPEPGSLALVGASLLALAATRRRRHQA